MSTLYSKKFFAGNVIGQPLIWGKDKTSQIKGVLDQFGPTTEAVLAMEAQGINPEKAQASVLVRVKVINGEVVKKGKSCVVQVTCSVKQLCVQGIFKGSTVIFAARGVAPWVAPNPEKNVKGNRTMNNGDKIHELIDYEYDSLVLDEEDTPTPMEFETEPVEKTKDSLIKGLASRVRDIVSIIKNEKSTVHH